MAAFSLPNSDRLPIEGCARWADFAAQHPLPETVRMAIDHALAEHLQNIVDHSGATQVEILFECAPKAVLVVVRDDESIMARIAAPPIIVFIVRTPGSCTPTYRMSHHAGRPGDGGSAGSGRFRSTAWSADGRCSLTGGRPDRTPARRSLLSESPHPHLGYVIRATAAWGQTRMRHRLRLGLTVAATVTVMGCVERTRETVELSPHYELRMVSGGGKRLHAQLFVRTAEADWTYFGSMLDPTWAARFPFGFTGLEAKNIAVSEDGRSIVYAHNAVLAGSKSTGPSGLYHHEFGVGSRLLLEDRAFGISATRYPKPLPAELLAVGGRGGRLAVSATGESTPLLVLGGTELHRASFEGDTAAVRSLAGGGPSVRDAPTYWDMSALEVAVVVGNEDVALVLLELGAVYRGHTEDRSLLWLASSFRRPRVVDALLLRDGIPGTPALDVTPPLHALLVRAGDAVLPDSPIDFESFAATLAVYLEHGTDIDATDEEGRTLLHLARTVPVVAYLIERGSDAEVRDAVGDTPLHGAVQIAADERHEDGWMEGKLPILRSLAERMATVDVRNGAGGTPLLLAVQRNHIRSAEYLISLGADPEVPFVHGGLGPRVAGQSIRERIASIKGGAWWRDVAG